jgi:hypothetical protein
VKKTQAYRQGIIKTKAHSVLLYGQVVYIIEELDDICKVRVSNCSNIEIIDKKNIIIY